MPSCTGNRCGFGAPSAVAASRMQNPTEASPQQARNDGNKLAEDNRMVEPASAGGVTDSRQSRGEFVTSAVELASRPFTGSLDRHPACLLVGQRVSPVTCGINQTGGPSTRSGSRATSRETPVPLFFQTRLEESRRGGTPCPTHRISPGGLPALSDVEGSLARRASRLHPQERQ